MKTLLGCGLILAGLQLRAQTLTLLHRYSFNDPNGSTNAADSVGGPAWAGTLVGDATISGGQLILPSPNNNSPATNYLQLSAGILTNSVDGVGTNENDPAVTVETWTTLAPAQNTWANLFDFGVQDTNINDAYSISFCVHTGGTPSTDAAISDTDNANGNRDNDSIPTPLDGRTNLYIAVVYDPPAGYEAVYTNGVLMGENFSVNISMAGVHGIRNIVGADNWPDPGLQGSIDEFRIWNGVLHPAQIAQDYQLGPNALPSASSLAPSLRAVLSGNNLLISWTTNGTAGFTLQSSAALSARATWSPVSGTPSVVGADYQMTVPITNSAQFFELKQ